MDTISMRPVLEEIGRRLRMARDRAGLTQSDVAGKLGVHLVSVSRWEQGAREPSVTTLYGLAALYGCGIADLLVHA